MLAKPGHTPKPWTIDPIGPGVINVCKGDNHDWIIAVLGEHTYLNETEANARLIAAAPSLLAAVEQCAQINCHDHSLDARRRMADILAAALAAARGD